MATAFGIGALRKKRQLRKLKAQTETPSLAYSE
jgi:hypothetical protein